MLFDSKKRNCAFSNANVDNVDHLDKTTMTKYTHTHTTHKQKKRKNGPYIAVVVLCQVIYSHRTNDVYNNNNDNIII